MPRARVIDLEGPDPREEPRADATTAAAAPLEPEPSSPPPDPSERCEDGEPHDFRETNRDRGIVLLQCARCPALSSRFDPGASAGYAFGARRGGGGF